MFSHIEFPIFLESALNTLEKILTLFQMTNLVAIFSVLGVC